MNKVIKGSKARELLLNGMEKVRDIVASTIGPHGKVVLISNENGIRKSRDGATVANSLKNLKLLHPVESIGAKYLIEVAQAVSKISGDGTSTGTIMTYEFIKKANSLLVQYTSKQIEKSLLQLQKMIDEKLPRITRNITSQSEEIQQIATISSNNNEEIGKLVYELISTLGKDAVYLVEESYDGKNRIEIRQGFSFKQGVASEELLLALKKGDGLKSVIQDPVFLLIEDKMSDLTLYRGLLEKVSRNQQNLVIIADDFAPEVLYSLSLNVLRGVLTCIPIKTPGYMAEKKLNILKDLSAFVGCSTYIEKELTEQSSFILGSAKKITISKDLTVIVNGAGDVSDRISLIKSALDDAKSEYEKNGFEERLASLNSGIGTIYLGGINPVEKKYNYDLGEDAIQACKQSLEHGIVSGAGSDFLELRKLISAESESDDLIEHFLTTFTSVAAQIVKNAGESSDLIVQKMIDNSVIYNAMTGKFEKNSKIINSQSNIKAALLLAIEHARNFVNLDCVIYPDIKVKSEEINAH